MTSETELQGLSMAAAECLLEGLFYAGASWLEGFQWIQGPRDTGGKEWLHESTEACTEIMVRVLWPAEQTVHGFKSAGGTYTARAIFDPTNEEDANDTIGSSYANESDPMLAYRVAVLRALIALKG